MEPLRLPAELLAMIERGVSVIVGSGDAQLRPSVMRAVGSRVGPGEGEITVYLSRPQSRQVLQDIAANGRIAVVFSQPSTHRSIQVKGSNAALRNAGPPDQPELARYLAAMEREIQLVGFAPELTRAMLACRLQDVVAVSFRPEQAFGAHRLHDQRVPVQPRPAQQPASPGAGRGVPHGDPVSRPCRAAQPTGRAHRVGAAAARGAVRREPDDLRFSFDDEDALVAIAGHLGAAIELLQAGDEPAETPAPVERPQAARGAPLAVRHFPSNDSVFINDRYLIKGVAGAILCKLLREHLAQGRTEFSNRELRLDPALRLPDFSDNLEARLLLLQRRLAEHGPDLRIEKTGRGRFRLVLQRPVQLIAA